MEKPKFSSAFPKIRFIAKRNFVFVFKLFRIHSVSVFYKLSPFFHFFRLKFHKSSVDFYLLFFYNKNINCEECV